MTRWVVLAPTMPDPGSIRGSAGPDLPGSVGGLGYSWDLDADAAPERPGTADAVALRPIRARFVPLDGPRVKRTLLLTVRAGTPADVLAEFESDLMAMPEHITTIRSWALSRVDHAAAETPWTHAWEQEYATVEGLTGEYLLNPYHWAHVDRWFDGEVPGAIVEPRLAHVFRWSESPVITPTEGD
ncbi:Dabb family protein [Embleya sp. NBC_00896]|uniref:Dabb family protein n=1 Tax=Embleya sp. NBC_00896 TaxID=2975961 RepID=UPI0038668D5E|nr:Dabb family protein [Embleya sp. NBC_00896]